ncbi:hypothetical protein MPS_0389 [Mycobacterium pseudoshottsii JCM 15466]|nr:hypothetical protein MPS_0389 [Mycobacterium pseudoshottsii JCM 15466]
MQPRSLAAVSGILPDWSGPEHYHVERKIGFAGRYPGAFVFGHGRRSFRRLSLRRYAPHAGALPASVG